MSDVEEEIFPVAEAKTDAPDKAYPQEKQQRAAKGDLFKEGWDKVTAADLAQARVFIEATLRRRRKRPLAKKRTSAPARTRTSSGAIKGKPKIVDDEDEDSEDMDDTRFQL